ncbi:Reverse transcriptase zinc-binding domain [Sesbania bispinosa]|nr:Reverse transcriptase zinc-binding domain [Sesbania bispinosa]
MKPLFRYSIQLLALLKVRLAHITFLTLNGLSGGGRNTRFFHATTVQRRWRNRIVRVKDEGGNWVAGQEKIMQVAVQHYEKDFGKSFEAYDEPFDLPDVLTHLIQRARDEGEISCFAIASSAPKLTHLLFADDSLFFAKADPHEAYVLKGGGWIRFWFNRWRIYIMLDVGIVLAKKGSKPFWIWASILEGRDFARRNDQWLIANGNDINAWEDRWLWSKETLTEHKQPGVSTVHELLDNNNRKWDVQKIKQVLPSRFAIKAFQTPVSWFQERDKLIWPFARDGGYSVRTGYHVVRSEMSQGLPTVSISHLPPTELWKEIWNLQVPQKVRMFVWRACNNALPVMGNLFKRKIAASELCPICNRETETLEHTLLLCDWASLVWFGSQFHWLPTPMSVSRLDIWLWNKICFLREDPQTADSQISHLAMLLWTIWKQRNMEIYRYSKPNPITAITQASSLSSEYHKANVTVQNINCTNRRVTNIGSHWKAPPQGFLKCNSDAAWHGPFSPGAIAFLVRDSSSCVLTGHAKRAPASSPLVAEALALREAVLAAYNMQWNKGVVADILTVAEGFIHCGFTWVQRQANKVAYHIAQAVLANNLPPSWSSVHPSWLLELLSQDSARRPRSRQEVASGSLDPLQVPHGHLVSSRRLGDPSSQADARLPGRL